MRSNITSFLDKMDEILPNDMKHKIVKMINKDDNINIIRNQKQRKANMHQELIKVSSTVYNFDGIRLYRNTDNNFMLENSIENRNIFLCSRRNVIDHDNQIVPLTNNISAEESNEIVLFNGDTEPQRRIKIFVMYI